MRHSSPSPLAALAAGCVGSLVALLSLVAVQATADQDPTTDQVPRHIPYHGMLTLDGQAVDRVGGDAPWMRFELRASASPEDEVLFTQEERVEVHKGRFSVSLGELEDPENDLQQVILEHSSRLYVHVTLLGDGHDPDAPEPGDDLTFSNPQLLGLSPLAMWATNATHFEVADALLVRGSLQIADSITLEATGDLNASGSLLAEGDLNLEGDLSWDVEGQPGRSGKVFSHSGDTLVLNPDGDFSGGSAFQGNLRLSGPLSVGSSQGLSVSGADAMIQVGDAGGTHQVVFGGRMRIAYETSSNDLVIEEADGSDELLRINRDSQGGVIFGKDLSVIGTLVPGSVRPTVNITSSANNTGTLTFNPGGDGLSLGSGNNISFTPSSLDVQGRILRTTTIVQQTSSSNGNSPNLLNSRRNLSLGVTESEAVCYASRIIFHKISSSNDAAQCLVYLSGTAPNRTWYLRSGVSSDSDEVGAECSARCIKW